MRTKLRKINNIRGRFSGTFVRYGKKHYGLHETATLLLSNITAVDTGRVVAKHLWFNETVALRALGKLAAGDVIKFEARVVRYVKGYRGYKQDVFKPVEVDYKLSYPAKVVRVPNTLQSISGSLAARALQAAREEGKTIERAPRLPLGDTVSGD